MAQKSGTGWFWLVLGLLAGVGLTLGVLLFLNSGSGDDSGGRTLADDAAANAVQPEVVLPAPATPAEKTGNVPPPGDAGIDPASDDQIADDAAASGMTSRTPPTPDGE
ncbi:MAG: hypothetical protein HY859_10835 [Caulobacterales bacterium]|nr:hypothetical protein [Caulobacterales bacterium]